MEKGKKLRLWIESFKMWVQSPFNYQTVELEQSGQKTRDKMHEMCAHRHKQKTIKLVIYPIIKMFIHMCGHIVWIACHLNNAHILSKLLCFAISHHDDDGDSFW